MFDEGVLEVVSALAEARLVALNELHLRPSSPLEEQLRRRDWDALRDETGATTISQENLRAFAELEDSLVGSIYCLFAHGSSTRGTGRVVPNIDFRKCSDGSGLPGMNCQVVPSVRDDLDVVGVFRGHTPDVEAVQFLLQGASDRWACDITLNLVEEGVAWDELNHEGGSPALRRILAFNQPVAFRGGSQLQAFRKTASEHVGDFDWLHEADFRALMSLALILVERGEESLFLSPEQLCCTFPSIGFAWEHGLPIGFPARRHKLNAYPGLRDKVIS